MGFGASNAAGAEAIFVTPDELAGDDSNDDLFGVDVKGLLLKPIGEINELAEELPISGEEAAIGDPNPA